MSNLMTKYLFREDIETLTDLKTIIDEDNIIVTCMGLYNHGKSTLLNALIKDFEHKTFKTADVRETVTNKKVKYENLTFVDTPGLNAQKYDDKRVMDAAKESDINIFVHNVTTGEFVASEVAFFHNIKKYWENPQKFIDSTIFVVSRIDQVNDESDIGNTIEKMSNQIFEIFHTKAKIIPVSAIRYTKGQIENKELMIKKSNMKILEKSIKDLSDTLRDLIRETRKVRLEKEYDNLIKRFSSKIQENKLEITKQEKAEKIYLTELDKDIDRIESTLKNMYIGLGE